MPAVTVLDPRTRARPRRGPARTRARRGAERPRRAPPARVPRRGRLDVSSIDASRPTRRRSGRVSAGWSPSSVPTGLVVLGAGSIPLATAADLAAFVRAAAAGDAGRARQPSLLRGRPGDRVRTRRAARTCRTSPPTTRCPAGWPRSPACRFATCARGAGWRWTSTRRWTCCCSAASAAPRRLPGPAMPTAGPSATGSRRSGHSPPIPARSCWSPAARPPPTWAGSRRDTRSPDAGARRGARPADRRDRGDARAAEPPPAPQPCWASCSIATARSRSAATSPRLADGALIDSRVLLAHRLGADERGWPHAGGPVRERPAPRRPRPRPVAARPDRGGRGRRRPDPARRPQPGRPGRALRARALRR